MKKRCVFFLLALCVLLAFSAAAASAVELTAELTAEGAEETTDALPPVYGTDKTIIGSASVTLTPPKAGEYPDFTPELPNGAMYYSAAFNEYPFRNDVMWRDVTTDNAVSPGTEKFRAGHVYRVTVYLTPKSEYAFYSGSTARLNGNAAECRITADGQLAVEYTFPALPEEITSVSLTITPPAIGAKPDYNPVFPSGANYYSADYTNDFYKGDVCWGDEATGTILKVGAEFFTAGRSYVVIVYLTAKDGFVFSETAAGTVNGEEAECEIVDGQLEVRYTFPALPKEITSVSLTITPPAIGAAPDYNPVLPSGVKYYSADYSDDHMKNDVRWFDETAGSYLKVSSDTFAAGHVYELEVFFTAKDGYAFSETAAATVNGNAAECSIDNGQLRVTYTFPPVPELITSADVTITAPAAGKSPDYNPYVNPNADYYSVDYCDDTMFKNDVVWKDDTSDTYLNPTESVTFQAGHSYHVTIYLTPKKGFAFASSVSCTLNGQSVTGSVTEQGQLRIRYNFPALPQEITSVSVTITPPAVGAKPDYNPVFPSGANYYSADYTNDFYKGDVFWGDEATGTILKVGAEFFTAGRSYVVIVYLTAKDGFVFSETAAGTVNGEEAECEIVDGQLEVRYTFPALPTLSSIKVTKAPTKTTYIEGEKFSKSGMEVTATYSDKSTKKITDYTYKPTAALKTTDKSITISYTEGGVTKTTTQKITVKAKTLTGIKITTPPTKTNYTEGEKFSKTGMVVTASYDNGTTAKVTDYTFKPTAALKTTDTKVTISYTEGGVTKTATQAITVKAKSGTVTRGDVNGDGKVNSNDAIHLLRYTMDKDRFPINQSGDMNGDGKVNSNDAIHLLRHTMSPERFPLKG